MSRRFFRITGRDLDSLQRRGQFFEASADSLFCSVRAAAHGVSDLVKLQPAEKPQPESISLSFRKFVQAAVQQVGLL